MVGRTMARIMWCCAAASMTLSPAVLAQEERASDTTAGSSWVTLSGSAGISTDLYSFSNPDGAQQGRRPASLTRLFLSPTLSFGEWFSLPLNLVLTLPETNTTTPAISAPSLTEMFANPINQLGITLTSEKLGGSRIHLGTHTPKYSELSGGDLQLFGAGVDARLGKVQTAFSAGVVQRAIATDTARGVSGRFRRDMYMARVGLGTTDAGKIGLNVVYAADDRTSLRTDVVRVIPARPLETDPSVQVPPDTVRLQAQQGAVITIDGSTEFMPGVTFKSEAAVSAFTPDLRDEQKSIGEGSTFFDRAMSSFSTLFSPRISTWADVSGTASVIIRQQAWGLTLSALYMGPGFMPLGYPFMQTDRIDLMVSPSLQVFDGDLTINGSVGQRVNNLSETKGEALTQLIANGSVNAQFSDAFSVSVSYANFGIRSNTVFDTLKIENVSQSFSIDPSIMIEGSGAMHSVNGSVAFDTFEDFNVVTGAESSNDTRSATLTYSAMLTDMPLTLGAMGTYVENALFSAALIVRTVGLNASYRLLAGALTTSLSYTLAGSSFGSNPTDTQSFLKASARWAIAKNISLVASLSNNMFAYGRFLPNRGTSFSEQIMQLALNTTF